MQRRTFTLLIAASSALLAACGRADGSGGATAGPTSPPAGPPHTAAPAHTAAPPRTPPAEPATAEGPREGPREEHKGHETLYYKSGALDIEAYVYRPEGKGPFPAVIYNHGSRSGEERKEVPFAYVGNMLAAHGYVVLVPERRGYGKSGGETFAEATKGGEQFVPRMEEEAGDVLAGLDHLKTMPGVDAKRVGMMGWSFGGIVTILALARTKEVRAAVDQAGGSLSWKGSAPLRAAMADAAGKASAPVLSMDAENDATTESVKAVDAAVAAHHGTHKLVVYPAFTPSHPSDIAPGHLIFSAEGMKIWQDDVLRWMDEYVKGKG